MIKGNESDVRNIDLELQAKRGDKFYWFELQRILHIFTTTCPIEMGFGSKWHSSIFTGHVIYIEKSKLNIADMWLIPLDLVTYMGLLGKWQISFIGNYVIMP